MHLKRKEKKIETDLAVGYEDHLRARLVVLLGFRSVEYAQDVGHDDCCVAARLETLLLLCPIEDVPQSEDRLLGLELERRKDLDVFARGYHVLAERVGDHFSVWGGTRSDGLIETQDENRSSEGCAQGSYSRRGRR